MKEKNPGTSEFLKLDLGSGKPSSLPVELIQVKVNAELLLGDYARAFLTQMHSRRFLRAKEAELTEEEIIRYCEFLLQRRVALVNETITDLPRLKGLMIPSFIQFCLENIGRVRIVDRGLEIRPLYDAKVIKLEEAIAISAKIALYESDISMVPDAMPRGLDGNRQVMTMALIADYVRGMEDATPISSYVAAFLGLKLVEENVYASLYRVVYDDVGFIRSALPHKVIL